MNVSIEQRKKVAKLIKVGTLLTWTNQSISGWTTWKILNVDTESLDNFSKGYINFIKINMICIKTSADLSHCLHKTNQNWRLSTCSIFEIGTNYKFKIELSLKDRINKLLKL